MVSDLTQTEMHSKDIVINKKHEIHIRMDYPKQAMLLKSNLFSQDTNIKTCSLLPPLVSLLSTFFKIIFVSLWTFLGPKNCVSVSFTECSSFHVPLKFSKILLDLHSVKYNICHTLLRVLAGKDPDLAD